MFCWRFQCLLKVQISHSAAGYSLYILGRGGNSACRNASAHFGANKRARCSKMPLVSLHPAECVACRQRSPSSSLCFLSPSTRVLYLSEAMLQVWCECRSLRDVVCVCVMLDACSSARHVHAHVTHVSTEDTVAAGFVLLTGGVSKDLDRHLPKIPTKWK